MNRTNGRTASSEMPASVTAVWGIRSATTSMNDCVVGDTCVGGCIGNDSVRDFVGDCVVGDSVGGCVGDYVRDCVVDDSVGDCVGDCVVGDSVDDCR